jgi:hypothetical protein
MDQVGAVLQQVRGQGVAGLVGHAVAKIESEQPLPEGTDEAAVADAPEQVAVSHPAREQRDGFAFRFRWRAAVALDEQGAGLGLSLLDAREEAFGDADGLVVVPDLRLVVPEQG